MWLFTRHGFYSVVAKASDPQTLKVRTRCRQDLEALRAFVAERCPELLASLSEMVETPQRDYGYRLFVPRSAWESIVPALASDIDYTNFKNETHGDPERDHAYMRVWSAMNAFQRH